MPIALAQSNVPCLSYSLTLAPAGTPRTKVISFSSFLGNGELDSEPAHAFTPVNAFHSGPKVHGKWTAHDKPHQIPNSDNQLFFILEG